jgi:hypothetical protein
VSVELVLSVLIVVAAAVALGVFVLRMAALARFVRGWVTARHRRRAGLPETDHTVRLTVAGSAKLLASCDDCGWERWTSARVAPAEQERELRAAAAAHGTTVTGVEAR